VPRILIIDDEPHIRKFLRISLQANGYTVAEAETGGEGVRLATADPPDLVIIDLGLPDMDGQDVISAIRGTTIVPIIVLSVRAAENDKVQALDRGADDYVVKPFGIAELMARVRVALRTRTPGPVARVRCANVEIDLERRVVSRDGAVVRLSRRELELLEMLSRHADHVVTHRQILREIWGTAHVGDTVYLRVYIKQLRQKLEDDPTQPRILITEPGIGYRLKTD
jgi:two-component system, OmpR family, KDP operon response regulator KdpE